MKIFICNTFGSYKYGTLPNFIYTVDHDDADKEYIRLMRQQGKIGSDQEILNKALDVWEIREIE